MVVEVFQGIDNCGDGRGRAWVSRQDWRDGESGAGHSWFAAEGHMEFVRVVESRMEAFSPCVSDSEGPGGGDWRSTTCVISTWRRNMLARARSMVGDVVHSRVIGLEGFAGAVED